MRLLLGPIALICALPNKKGRPIGRPLNFTEAQTQAAFFGAAFFALTTAFLRLM
ncbi:MAG: hypothetical protein ABSG87_00660 [Verrucomicrobiota bacterium]